MVSDGYGRHTPVLQGVNIVRAVSLDTALLPYVSDAISSLANNWQWVEIGDSIDDVVQACELAVHSWYSAMQVGQVSMFLGSLPDYWLPLDGTTYDEADYPELYAQLDAQYKNVPTEEFTLPELDDYFPVVAGGSYVVGDTGGEATVALTIAELAAHNHTYIQPIANVDLESPGVPDILAAGVGPGTTTGNTGSGDGHENLPPFYALIFGIFAGRD